MEDERFTQFCVAYAKYALGLEGVPSPNDKEFLRKLRYTLRQPPFTKIGVTEKEALEAVHRLSVEILEDT